MPKASGFDFVIFRLGVAGTAIQNFVYIQQDWQWRAGIGLHELSRQT